MKKFVSYLFSVFFGFLFILLFVISVHVVMHYSLLALGDEGHLTPLIERLKPEEKYLVLEDDWDDFSDMTQAKFPDSLLSGPKYYGYKTGHLANREDDDEFVQIKDVKINEVIYISPYCLGADDEGFCWINATCYGCLRPIQSKWVKAIKTKHGWILDYANTPDFVYLEAPECWWNKHTTFYKPEYEKVVMIKNGDRILAK